MDLFIQPEVHFEKAAAAVDLPEDPNSWSKEILDELFKQVPYIADFQPHVSMSKVDGERGYGLGHVEVANHTQAGVGTDPEMLSAAGVRSIRIPIIIKEGKLSPFDLLVNDRSKVIPLTESRLRQAIFRPQMFDATAATPGDQSMIGQLYPPYRSANGFGAGGVTVPAMGKEASAFEEYLITELEKLDSGFRRPKESTKTASPRVVFRKTASLLSAIASTIHGDDLEAFWGEMQSPGLQAQMRKNAGCTMGALSVLANTEPRSVEKTAAALSSMVRPTVAQITKVARKYRVKEANHNFWEPKIEYVDRHELVHRFGEKIALATDEAGGLTVAEGAQEAAGPAEHEVHPIEVSGTYRVFTTEGQELIGTVVPNLLDLDGEPVPLTLFTNGSQATVQSEVFGEKVDDGTAPVPLPSGPVQGMGAFFNDDGSQAVIPMQLQGSYDGEDGMTMYVGETYDGRPVEVSVQPNIAVPTPVDEGRILIPEAWKWTPLQLAKEVSLAGGPPPEMIDDVNEDGSGLKEASAFVTIRGDHTGQFTVTGPAVEKLASEDREYLDLDGAMFLLAALGVDQRFGVTKLGQAALGLEPQVVKVGRLIKTAAEERARALSEAREHLASTPSLRQSLVKEASTIPDPMAVDTVLSLGFINDENLMTFVSYLPSIDDAQMKLCEILLGVRLGMADISETALERSVRSVEEVIEGLKVIAFQSP